MIIINPKLSLKEIKQQSPNNEIVVFNQHDFYIYKPDENKLVNFEWQKEGINEVYISEFSTSLDLIDKHSVKQLESFNDTLDLFFHWKKNLQIVLI